LQQQVPVGPHAPASGLNLVFKTPQVAKPFVSTTILPGQASRGIPIVPISPCPHLTLPQRTSPRVSSGALVLQNSFFCQPGHPVKCVEDEKVTQRAKPVTPDHAGFAAKAFSVAFTSEVYDRMANDVVRVGAYAKAIAKAVPGKIVLDLGTGRDALLARICVDAGAAKVFAVEVVPAAAQRAREAIMRAGLCGRIEIIEGHSAMVALPKVDIVVHEIVGDVAAEEGVAGVLKDLQSRPEVVDSRARGWSLPRVIKTHMCPTSLQLLPNVGVPTLGGARVARLPLPPPVESLLAEPQVLEDIDAEQPIQLVQERILNWHIKTQSVLTGFICAPWIDLDGEQSIDAFFHRTSWRHKMAVLPNPVPVFPGDELELRACSDLRHFPPVYKFITQLRRFGISHVLGEVALTTVALQHEAQAAAL